MSSADSPPPAHLALVDDHGVVRQTVAVALRAYGFDVTVVDPRDDIAPAILHLGADLTLLDLDLGEGRDGADEVEALHRGGQRVLIFTGATDPLRLARCIASGAVGVLSKSAHLDEIIADIEQTLVRGTLLDAHQREEQIALVRSHEREAQARRAPFSSLTQREAAVLGELMMGRSAAEVARANEVSITTVRAQVRAILGKLGVGTQVAAIARANAIGWRPPTPDR